MIIVVIKNITGRNKSTKSISCLIFINLLSTKKIIKNTVPAFSEKIKYLYNLERFVLSKEKIMKNGVNNAKEVLPNNVVIALSSNNKLLTIAIKFTPIINNIIL